MDLAEGALLAAAAAAAGAVNSVAGGGTLISFPALHHHFGAQGAQLANATSTVALWPGMWGAMAAYRKDMKGSRPLLLRFAIPCVAGGALGAWLVPVSGERVFALLVPWLILGATLLFAFAARIGRFLERKEGADPEKPGPAVLLYQFGVSIYGGYFGAGAGILMLAALSLMGMHDIHRMNGVKVFLAMLLNAVAIVVFAGYGLVRWPEAGLMAVAALLGGYVGASLSKKVSRDAVRGVVIVVGFVMAGVEFWSAYAR
jgi:uncharacterized membrane protein YfcA